MLFPTVTRLTCINTNRVEYTDNEENVIYKHEYISMYVIIRLLITCNNGEILMNSK